MILLGSEAPTRPKMRYHGSRQIHKGLQESPKTTPTGLQAALRGPQCHCWGLLGLIPTSL